ncbi:squamosa promoter-binding protein [Striga asiatica]|uniref:Squamosa promoter-binding protein n=1 Tax=Striga asiatica TaxID=4170 RepID=A0A5A7PFG6_STRAF|nr:squamosa promoter-binding protein [Striga asiatica]
METKFDGKLHHFFGPVVSDLGKRSLEWDLNEWRWDGDLFLAAPLNSGPLDCKSRQLFPIGSNNGPCPEELMPSPEQEDRDSEKKKSIFDFENEEASGSLNLKLGGQVCPVMEGKLPDDDTLLQGKSSKKPKVVGAVCQVEDCKADLSSAKDYHRRHKVCDVHSKATCALVGNVMQRFCQQCSRFHVLKEFDEGKRSCRRRLAGHNKRRRKTHPENVVNAVNNNDEQGTNSSDQSKDQDLLSHLLSNLANLTGATIGGNNGGFPVSQDLQNTGTHLGPGPKISSHLQDLCTPTGPVVSIPTSDSKQKRLSTKEHAAYATVGKTKLNNIDLNDAYDDSQDCAEELTNAYAPENVVNMPCTGPLWLYKDSQQSSPPQISRNSGSTFSQSPSTSSGETQSRTDRIVFKLFGKVPSDFPLVLRKQILDWLSNSPTDVESYIRPGCIILTIYIHMDISSWDELYCDLASSLRRLLDSSTDPFWKTGWIYTRVQHHVTFLYNGQLVLDTPLPLKHNRNCRISSIKPIAVTVSESAQFSVKGFYLSCSTLSFSCVIPDIVGRGFIEVEDHGLNSSFFPFIVAEKDLCTEICSLESIFEGDESTEEPDIIRNQALEFIHEMGWLLHRNRLKYRLSGQTISGSDQKSFSFERFRWLVEFSVDHDWCAVVRKLLNILFDGTVDLGQKDSNNLQRLLEIGLLHRAVRRKCRRMVKFLLSYCLSEVLGLNNHYLFRPDAVGPGGLTPLHIAACLDNCESVVDALTEDLGNVGIKAWKTTKDSTGLTPHDYASLRGHHSYNNLVDKKLNNKSEKEHVIVDIFDIDSQKKTEKASKFGAALECENKNAMMSWHKKECGPCRAKRLWFSQGKCSIASSKSSVRLYRPAMVSMVAIAAVCVCTALLFKSSPHVFCVLLPFRWELLKYGSQ